MSKSKDQIKTFLEGKEWENSKHAYSVYCTAFPKANPSVIYFYRVFAEVVTPVRKKQAIIAFIKAGNFASCKAAFAAYATGDKQHTSFNYFVQLYTAANKTETTVKVKSEKTKVITMSVNVITLSNLKAKEVIAKVAELTGQTITINLKNKASIVKKATAELKAKGYQVA